MADGGNNRLGFVESLRLLAAIVVVAQHLAEAYPDVGPLLALRHAGPGLVGVLLFFLISGYVVPMSLKGPFAPLPFLLRRVFRIYPLLLVAFALCLVVGAGGLLPQWAWLAGAAPFTWGANVLLVQDYVGVRPFLGVSWTLAVEFAWYGLFALSVARWGREAGGRGAGGRLAVALPLLLLGLAGASLACGIRLPLGRITFVYACVLGFQAFLHDRGQVSRQALLGHAGVFVSALLAVDLVGFGLFRHPAISLVQIVWPTLLAPSLFLASVLVPAVRCAPLLARGALPAIGSASYSLYLLHPVGIALGTRFGASYGTLAGIALSLAATALLALAGHRLVERPGVALGRRLIAAWTDQSQAKRAPVPA